MSCTRENGAVIPPSHTQPPKQFAWTPAGAQKFPAPLWWNHSRGLTLAPSPKLHGQRKTVEKVSITDGYGYLFSFLLGPMRFHAAQHTAQSWTSSGDHLAPTLHQGPLAVLRPIYQHWNAWARKDHYMQHVLIKQFHVSAIAKKMSPNMQQPSWVFKRRALYLFLINTAYTVYSTLSKVDI